MIWIYGCILENVVVYVGASVNPRRRLSRKRQEHGQALTLKILEEVNEDTWSERERYWIRKLQPKFNRHPGGGGGCVWKPQVDEAFCKRKSEASKKAWQDPTTREKLLTRTAARWADPEQKQRHIEKHTGAKRSALTRARISEAARNRDPATRKVSEETKAKISYKRRLAWARWRAERGRSI